MKFSPCSVLLLVALLLPTSMGLAVYAKNYKPTFGKGLLSEGSFRGGGAGPGFSLISLKRVYSTDGKSERLIFEIGDKEGNSYVGQPGYFHAQLFRKPSKLSLDLSQLLKSQVSPEEFKELFKKSKLVKSANISADEDDQSTNIQIQFKSAVKMRVFTLSPDSMSPKLIIDYTKK